MRRVLIAGAFVLAFPAFASAAPLCTTSSLQTYINLGAGGCSIGGATFFDFSSDPTLFPPAATEISAADILVTPTAPLGGAQLEFGLSAGAGSARSDRRADWILGVGADLQSRHARAVGQRCVE